MTTDETMKRVLQAMHERDKEIYAAMLNAWGKYQARFSAAIGEQFINDPPQRAQKNLARKEVKQQERRAYDHERAERVALAILSMPRPVTLSRALSVAGTPVNKDTADRMRPFIDADQRIAHSDRGTRRYYVRAELHSRLKDDHIRIDGATIPRGYYHAWAAQWLRENRTKYPQETLFFAMADDWKKHRSEKFGAPPGTPSKSARAGVDSSGKPWAVLH